MSVLDPLRQKARDWALEVVKLHNTPVPPPLQTEKTRLLNNARTVKNAVEKVFGTLDELRPMAQIKELGAIPIVIPVVAVSGASAAIAKWYYDHKNLMSRVNSYNALTAGGLDHNQALNIITQGKTSILDTVKRMAIPLTVAGVIYFIVSRRGN
jgi:hypothetical protein